MKLFINFLEIYFINEIMNAASSVSKVLNRGCHGNTQRKCTVASDEHAMLILVQRFVEYDHCLCSLIIMNKITVQCINEMLSSFSRKSF